ncbi:MAG TPA: efflux RND transporter periplasmic adaptor subunit [Woeseiaceae bacterium]|nr:efflux RND transporter periplasmic adaptor subunit [Woeseiaceae bacterium]
MKRSSWLIAAAAAGLAVAAAGGWLLFSNPQDGAAIPAQTGMPRYRAAGLDVGVTIEPEAPRVGENRLIVDVRTPAREPVSGLAIGAYVEMPSMGAMPAMRAPAEMREVAPGRYAGSFDIPVRGPWPLTLSFASPDGAPVRLQFDLATGREGLTLASGAEAAGSAAAPAEADASVITIDNRRRQTIGVETGKAALRKLTKSIRAVGTVTFDERLLSQVTLKFDAFIGDLKADYVGAPVEAGQVLFTVYSPDLLAAQQEYLAMLDRGSGGTVLAAARQRLRLWDLSDATIAALEKRGTPQAYVPILAPRSGTLIERNIADGGAARGGQTLLTIADLSRVWIEAEVFEGDLALVREGMPAIVNLPYLPGRTATGTVDYVYPWLDGDSRTGRIRLSVDNPAGAFKPDMYAEVALQVSLGQRLTVPEEAIIFAGENRIAFVDLGGGRLKPVRVQIGHRAGGFVEITDGLSPGDTVVTSANFLISAEARLQGALRQW